MMALPFDQRELMNKVREWRATHELFKRQGIRIMAYARYDPKMTADDLREIEQLFRQSSIEGDKAVRGMERGYIRE
jgi:hypothetical protein